MREAHTTQTKLLSYTRKSIRTLPADFHIPNLCASLVDTNFPGVLSLTKEIILTTYYISTSLSPRTRYIFEILESQRSGRGDQRGGEEKKTPKRDKMGSQCSNINMTSPILSLQYTF